MSVYAKLLNVQHELKVEKGQFNSFGNYRYRSCEDIMAGAKPLCHAAGLLLTVTDTIEMIGTRYYVKAEATIMDVETKESHTVTASAREEESKKGMDGSQVTGAASSYARKYALNGLFAIDDTKDADALPPEPPKANKPTSQPTTPKQSENAAKGQETPNTGTETPAVISAAQVSRLYAIASGKGKKKEIVIAEILKNYNVTPEAVTKAMYNAIVKHYESLPDAAK